jgi:hypothetical protein
METPLDQQKFHVASVGNVVKNEKKKEKEPWTRSHRLPIWCLAASLILSPLLNTGIRRSIFGLDKPTPVATNVPVAQVTTPSPQEPVKTIATLPPDPAPLTCEKEALIIPGAITHARWLWGHNRDGGVRRHQRSRVFHFALAGSVPDTPTLIVFCTTRKGTFLMS